MSPKDVCDARFLNRDVSVFPRTARGRNRDKNERTPEAIHVMSNDEVERRGVALSSNEVDLSRSSTLSLAHRRCCPAIRSNRWLGIKAPPELIPEPEPRYSMLYE